MNESDKFGYSDIFHPLDPFPAFWRRYSPSNIQPLKKSLKKRLSTVPKKQKV